MNLLVGDVIKLKKPHPCGSFEWEVLRIGSDIKVICQKCGHIVMSPRVELEKRITEVLKYDK